MEINHKNMSFLWALSSIYNSELVKLNYTYLNSTN